MAQSGLLINALKRALKAQGITYAELAGHLQLSEASVKRLFAQQNFSLQRLDQVCQLLGLEISDLARMAEQQEMRLSQLSEAQEREIVADLELLLVTVCVLNRWTLAEISRLFNLSELRCIQHLAKLDRLQMLDLLPGNRVRLRVAANFRWRENGPIQRFFMENLQEEFFNSRFDHAREQLLVLNGMLCEASIHEVQQKLNQLAREFEELNSRDAKLPFEQRFGTTVVMAMRPWRYGLFRRFMR